VTPPAGLPRLHPTNLANVLVLGGTAAMRMDVAETFHRGSRLRRGPFVCLDGSRHEPELHRALEAWLSGVAAGPWSDPLHAAAYGTLFLDGVDSLSSRTQSLLLTFT
jgi:DNA-binding NtrC family response regulator